MVRGPTVVRGQINARGQPVLHGQSILRVQRGQPEMRGQPIARGGSVMRGQPAVRGPRGAMSNGPLRGHPRPMKVHCQSEVEEVQLEVNLCLIEAKDKVLWVEVIQ